MQLFYGRFWSLDFNNLSISEYMLTKFSHIDIRARTSLYLFLCIRDDNINIVVAYSMTMWTISCSLRIYKQFFPNNNAFYYYLTKNKVPRERYYGHVTIVKAWHLDCYMIQQKKNNLTLKFTIKSILLLPIFKTSRVYRFSRSWV